MVVANTDLLARFSDGVLMIIADLVAKGFLRDIISEGREGREGAAARVWAFIRAMSGASKRTRAITIDAVRPGLALVLRVAPPQTLSTRGLLLLINADQELSMSVCLKTERTEVESAAILSRLVDLSRACVAASIGANKLHGLIVGMIESARPALRASLRRATVQDRLVDGVLAMYADHGAVADAAIEKLKLGPYARIVDAPGVERKGMGHLVADFILDVNGGRAAMIDLYGPLCLWDVSGVADLFRACTLLGAKRELGFSSDLFWSTKSATSMNEMFYMNDRFDGHIGTWDVSSVGSMRQMFRGSAIKDSGIANWNTASLFDAYSMFFGALHLSADLDLSGWIFADGPNMAHMFSQSGIVDCGIGKWNVANATTVDMLSDASKFTGYASLVEPNWPAAKRDDAVPETQRRFTGSGVGFGSAGVGATEARHREIARVLAAGLRFRTRGTPRGSQSSQSIPGASERPNPKSKSKSPKGDGCSIL